MSLPQSVACFSSTVSCRSIASLVSCCRKRRERLNLRNILHNRAFKSAKLETRFHWRLHFESWERVCIVPLAGAESPKEFRHYDVLQCPVDEVWGHGSQRDLQAELPSPPHVHCTLQTRACLSTCTFPHGDNSSSFIDLTTFAEQVHFLRWVGGDRGGDR